jgi:hypothetical protein
MHAPLRLAIWHDMSKLTPAEWCPYVRQFFYRDGSRRQVRDALGAYVPSLQTNEFKRAWLSHQRLKHHWQSWVLIGDGRDLYGLPIPEVYLREMIADWIGAGRANGKVEPKAWYERNKHTIIMHPASRRRLEELLREIKDG